MKILLNAFNRLEEYIMIIIFPIMVAMVFGATVVRYFRLGSVPWADEASRYLMILLVFVGAAYGFRRNTHLGVSFIVDRLPKRLHTLCLWLRAAILMGFAVLMLYSTTILIQVQMGFVQRTAALQLPMHGVYFIMLIGWILIITRIAQAAFYDIVKPAFTKKTPGDSEGEERK